MLMSVSQCDGCIYWLQAHLTQWQEPLAKARRQAPEADAAFAYEASCTPPRPNAHATWSMLAPLGRRRNLNLSGGCPTSSAPPFGAGRIVRTVVFWLDLANGTRSMAPLPPIFGGRIQRRCPEFPAVCTLARRGSVLPAPLAGRHRVERPDRLFVPFLEAKRSSIASRIRGAGLIGEGGARGEDETTIPERAPL